MSDHDGGSLDHELRQRSYAVRYLSLSGDDVDAVSTGLAQLNPVPSAIIGRSDLAVFEDPSGRLDEDSDDAIADLLILAVDLDDVTLELRPREQVRVPRRSL
jgi:predicted ABC-type transport system involved in lysophospholipase L1 biosynthesis ATPase subunit